MASTNALPVASQVESTAVGVIEERKQSMKEGAVEQGKPQEGAAVVPNPSTSANLLSSVSASVSFNTSLGEYLSFSSDRITAMETDFFLNFFINFISK